MRLADAVKLRNIRADGSTGEWFEVYYGYSTIPTFHPPSLKDPIPVPVDMPTDGWHEDDPDELKQKAREELAEVMRRLLRQSGKPELTQQALYPIFPAISRWT